LTRCQKSSWPFRKSWLLQMLQRDGYLLESRGKYTFRSFLLRDYWHRRYIT